MKEVARVALAAGHPDPVAGTGLPLVIIGTARITGARADGRIVYLDGQAVGAREIGQEVHLPSSSTAGLPRRAMVTTPWPAPQPGPLNPELEDGRARLEGVLAENPGIDPGEVPVELVTASASGLDPDIGETPHSSGWRASPERPASGGRTYVPWSGIM